MTIAFYDKIYAIDQPAKVARMLRIERTTLYNYMRGITPTPAHISTRVDEIHASMTATMERMPGFIAELLKRDFPNGIRSEDDGAF